MKFYIPFTFLLMCFNSIFSQETIKIPDVALEEALIDLKIDTNGLNGTILVSDARYVVNLNVSDPLNNKDLPNVNSKIKDLTGIEYFQNLKRLDCYGNAIHKINLTKNTELSFLNCSNNKIRELDLSNNPNLFLVSCDSNKITSLKLGSKPKLTELYCNVNRLTVLDLKGCYTLESMDVSGNEIDEVLVSSSIINNIPKGWYKDKKTSYVTVLGQKTTAKTEPQTVENTVSQPNENVAITTTNPAINTQKTEIATSQTPLNAKEQYENFKRLAVKEFDNNIPEKQHLKLKQSELEQKYQIANEELTKWINQYSKVLKSQNTTTNKEIAEIESFKKLVVKEFDRKALDKNHMNLIKEKIQKKYNIGSKELDKWINEYSEMMKLRTSLSQEKARDSQLMLSAKKQFENFKRSLAEEFDKIVLDAQYLKNKQEEIQRKYNIDIKEINKWIKKHSKVLKLQNH